MGFIDRQDSRSEGQQKEHDDKAFQHGEGIFYGCQSSREAQPLHRSRIVLWNPLSLAVLNTQIVLGNGIPLFGKRCPFTQSSCLVLSVVRIQPLLEISTPTNTCTSKKHGKEQAENCGQISHRGSLADLWAPLRIGELPEDIV